MGRQFLPRDINLSRRALWAKIHQKYRKSYFLCIFEVLLGYFEGCYVFLSCRGPSLSQAMGGGGGGKKRGVENLTNDTPPKKEFWTPPRTVRFPPPSGVSASLEGSKHFRESAFSGTFSSSHTFCTPPISRPNFLWKTKRKEMAGMSGDLGRDCPGFGVLTWGLRKTLRKKTSFGVSLARLNRLKLVKIG